MVNETVKRHWGESPLVWGRWRMRTLRGLGWRGWEPGALEKKCDTIVLLRYVVLLFRRYDSYCTYHERYESYRRSTFSYSTLTK